MSKFGSNDFGFGTVGVGGGGGGCNIYLGASPTTVTVGGLPAGSAIYGCTLQQIDELILVPYVAPTFSSFAISGQSQTLEVGTTVSGSKTFTWAFTNASNVSANTMNIIDGTTSTVLASNISIVSPYAVSVGTITNSSSTSHYWFGRATNTQTTVFNSSSFTINWYWRLWYGTSTNTTLDATQIQALSSSAISSTKNGTYNYAAGNYKYFVWDDSLGSPTAVTGFKDASTNLGIAMADATDDVFYANTQNGWSYGLVSVTQNGVTSNKRVYRTKNQLGGTLSAIVS